MKDRYGREIDVGDEVIVNGGYAKVISGDNGSLWFTDSHGDFMMEERYIEIIKKNPLLVGG